VVAGQHLEEHRKASEIDSAISADVIWGIYYDEGNREI
jgi:hypothetical protein